jgi:hypothetical protein
MFMVLANKQFLNKTLIIDPVPVRLWELILEETAEISTKK